MRGSFKSILFIRIVGEDESSKTRANRASKIRINSSDLKQSLHCRGCENNQRPSSWERRRPRLPPSSSTLIGNAVTVLGANAIQLVTFEGAGGDARAPSTMVSDYFHSFCRAGGVRFLCKGLCFVLGVLSMNLALDSVRLCAPSYLLTEDYTAGVFTRMIRGSLLGIDYFRKCK